MFMSITKKKYAHIKKNSRYTSGKQPGFEPEVIFMLYHINLK